MDYFDDRLIFERGAEGRRATMLPVCDVPLVEPARAARRAKAPALPQVSQVELVRHYTNLSRKAYGVDNGFYPLGSCTMKYNPKINEDVASLPGFQDIHPLQPPETAEGCLELINLCRRYFCEITGMDDMTMQPAAGAQGEFTGLMLIRAYFQSRGESKRTRVLVPDSAHGTNPASAVMAGFTTVTIPSNAQGNVDVEALKRALNEETAAIMMTNPNTLGLFERDIVSIANMAHEAGALLYYDGANMNAIMGIARPGDMGFDVVHLNLHKTFSTPHGGGGPGSGAVGCKDFLSPFLPNPQPNAEGTQWQDSSQSIGKVTGFYGNFLVYVRALTYILSLGGEGLREASENAVLNANYMLFRLKSTYPVPYHKGCMHEFVLSLDKLKKNTGVSAADIAKNLIDHGIHPPTMYFPLIVPEALMIEPTETEPREALDMMVDTLITLHDRAYETPGELHDAPQTTPVRRLDEVRAARTPVLKYEATE